MFEKASKLAFANLKRKKEVISILGIPLYKVAKRILKWSRRPLMMEEVYIEGFEHIPGPGPKQPIFAGSHKTIRDVFVYFSLFASRPLNRFYHLTAVGQAGIFSAIYPYRDLMPSFLKKPFWQPLALKIAHWLGNKLSHVFRSANVFPVYRKGSDIPSSAGEYYAPRWAGKKVTGMEYGLHP